jgi:hypothetical protein
MKRKNVALALFLLVYISLFCKDIDFFREDLSFELKDGFFYVQGKYYFRNNTGNEIKTLLFYPIPQDSLYGKADNFFATCEKDSTDKLTKANEKGFFFVVEIPPNSEQIYNIGYRQQMLGNKAEYILTTTQGWGKSFETANYLLSFPANVKLDSLSYMPDSLNLKNNSYHFFYHKQDFMPDKNFIIQFEKEF